MKDQIQEIINTLQGKIQRAKERKAVQIANDPNYIAMKGNIITQFIIILGHTDKLNSLASQRKDLKKETEYI